MIKYTAIYHYRTNESRQFTRERGNWISRGGVTVAYVPSADGKTLRVGVSRCSSLDAFNRKYGVLRATKRASSEQFSTEVPNTYTMTQLGDLGLKIAENKALTKEQLTQIFA